MSKKNKISASHILLMHKESQNSRSELTSDEAKKKIDDIYEDIKSGKVKFADAAVQYSNCPSGQSGGSLGEFTKGMMVKAFEDVAFSLDVEQISEPFESEFGFHIVKRDN
jgi:parvulin-like peptidyl-prolyl isomerase|tara:strand:- start:228 stop:557 length:330 start_codon:yes stop_codon:yes gene_type:complete